MCMSYDVLVWLARPSHLIAGALRAAPRAVKWDGLASQTNDVLTPRVIKQLIGPCIPQHVGKLFLSMTLCPLHCTFK